MRTIFGRDKLMEMGKERLRGKVLPILALSFVIAISVGIFLYHDRIAELGYYGYPSVFLVSMIWNSTVLVVIPSFWIYFPLQRFGPDFFPPLLGLAGGAGAAVGELTAYMAGYSGRGILQRRRGYARAERWVKRWGAIIIFGFNFVPLFPIDLIGIAAGALRYPLWKFFLICLAGRSLAYTIIACIGAGWIQLPGWMPLPLLNPPQ